MHQRVFQTLQRLKRHLLILNIDVMIEIGNYCVLFSLPSERIDRIYVKIGINRRATQVEQLQRVHQSKTILEIRKRRNSKHLFHTMIL